jgi:hypothetical protein
VNVSDGFFHNGLDGSGIVQESVFKPYGFSFGSRLDKLQHISPSISVSIHSPRYAAGTVTGNDVKVDSVFLKAFNNTDMGYAFCRTAAEGNSYFFCDNGSSPLHISVC